MLSIEDFNWLEMVCFFLLQDIIRLPRLFRFLQRPLAQFISTLRAPKSAEGYAAIGGGSPLRQITNEQVVLYFSEADYRRLFCD